MIVFPNCKINLGLSVVRKREDKFHELQTVFYPIAFYDALEIVTSGETAFNYTGLLAGLDPANNLCQTAYDLLRSEFPSIPPVKTHLHKVIPVGAGLGGGSSDAAFMLKLLDKKFSLGLSTDQLTNYAAGLGSDCPFFIINEPCYATGRGEILEPVRLDLSMYQVVIVNPGIHINTGLAFSLVTPSPPQLAVKEIIKLPVDQWKQLLVNDFEKPVFKRFPRIRELKEQLYAAGAFYASMTGSGSTVFGLFPRPVKPQLNFPSDYLVRIC